MSVTNTVKIAKVLLPPDESQRVDEKDEPSAYTDVLFIVKVQCEKFDVHESGLDRRGVPLAATR